MIQHIVLMREALFSFTQTSRYPSLRSVQEKVEVRLGRKEALEKHSVFPIYSVYAGIGFLFFAFSVK